MSQKAFFTGHRIRVGITMGDPAGVGPTILAKAIKTLKGLAEFVIIGDKWVFDKVAKDSAQRSVASPKGTEVTGIKFIDLNNVSREKFKFGRVRAGYGRAALEYLDKALELIKNKEIDCLVTCPVSKEALNLAGINFTGHTEYLAKKTKTKDFVMMLLNRELRTCLVTRHIPISGIQRQLRQDKIRKTVCIAYQSLKDLFLIKNPRIVVAGLNPHASDNGVIGNEEKRIIKPALAKLKARLGDIDGPVAADVAFWKAKEREYDCVVAMYHDQAMIALKISGISSGVNITLGLPFIRTSPLHGTAFDIAGTDLPSPTSLIEAVRLAIKCAINLKRA